MQKPFSIHLPSTGSTGSIRRFSFVQVCAPFGRLCLWSSFTADSCQSLIRVASESPYQQPKASSGDSSIDGSLVFRFTFLPAHVSSFSFFFLFFFRFAREPVFSTKLSSRLLFLSLFLRRVLNNSLKRAN